MKEHLRARQPPQRSDPLRSLKAIGICAALLCSVDSIAAEPQFTTLKGHGGPIMTIDVSQSGQVATGSFDNSIGLWAERTPTWLEGHNAAITTLTFAGPEHLLTGSDDFRVLLWRLGQNEPQEITRHQGKISRIAMHARTGRIATASWDGAIHLLTPIKALKTAENLGQYDHNTTILLGHQSNVSDVAFAPSGGLFSASADGTLRVWEGSVDDLRPRTIVKHGFGINRMVVTDTWIAYGAVDGGTRVIDPNTGAQIADFTLDRRPILSMEYHADTQQLAVGDGEGYIMIIDTARWRIARDFRATRHGPVWALAFSPGGDALYAGGLDDVAYSWPVALLGEFEPGISGQRSFLRDAATMSNGERQFMRKCSICHALEAGPSRKAGPTLHGVFGRQAGAVPDYAYSPTLREADIVWTDDTIDALFDQGPDHYIPGSKMPMQVIAKPTDRVDLITFLKSATQGTQP